MGWFWSVLLMVSLAQFSWATEDTNQLENCETDIIGSSEEPIKYFADEFVFQDGIQRKT